MEGNFFDFYFGNSKSDGEFEGFDPKKGVISLWYWILGLFVQQQEYWLYVNQSIF